MSNLKNLTKYFENTSKEQIQEDWDKYKHLDSVGITVNDYIKVSDFEAIKNNWNTTDTLIYRTPETKLKSLEAAKTKVISKN